MSRPYYRCHRARININAYWENEKSYMWTVCVTGSMVFFVSSHCPFGSVFAFQNPDPGGTSWIDLVNTIISLGTSLPASLPLQPWLSITDGLPLVLWVAGICVEASKMYFTCPVKYIFYIVCHNAPNLIWTVLKAFHLNIFHLINRTLQFDLLTK